MAIVFVYTLYLILIVLNESTICDPISRSLCLETAVGFMYDHESCNFDLRYAQNSLEEKNSSCKTKCTVEIDDVQTEQKNILWEVDIEVDGANWKYLSSCATQIQDKQKITMFIDCQKWNADSMKKLFRLVDGEGQKITIPNSPQHNHEEASIETIMGALFGGLLIGVILTTATVAIIYRRSKKHVSKREDLIATFSGSIKCSSATVVDHNSFQNIQTTDKKRKVSPYACSEETSNPNHASRNSGNGQTQDDVYNHLHEQGKHDGNDYYDHARAASAHLGDMGDYSHLCHVTSHEVTT